MKSTEDNIKICMNFYDECLVNNYIVIQDILMTF